MRGPVLTGNTVKITAKFTDWDDNAVNPSNVRFTMYNANKRALGNTITVPPTGEVGTYVVFYNIPEKPQGEIVYEFVGTVAGKQVVERGRILKDWIR